MDQYSCSTALEAGTSLAPTPVTPITEPFSNRQTNTNNNRYIFPTPRTKWDGPDKSYNPIFWRILSFLDNYIPVTFEKKKTHHVPFTAPDVDGCLAKEALEVYTEESPSNDAFGMGVLVFGRLHHLNLHAFE